MDRLQRNGGIFGILAGVALAMLFAAFATSGITPDILGDPAKALPLIREQATRLKLIGLFGALAVAFSLPFAAALYLRLRNGAPTRATTGLLLLLVGLIGHGLGSLVVGVGFPTVAAVTDQTAASPAYLAVLAASQVADTLGNAFTGAGDAVVGWAIVSTAALPTIVGWVFALTGIVSVLLALVPGADILFIGSIVLTIISLIWGGVALRRAAS